MNEEQDLKLTDLDYLIGDHHLQMMKAALPYMKVPEQMAISFFVKFNELRRTLDLFQGEENASLGICSLGDQPATPWDMLTAIKPFGNTYEQEFIDTIYTFSQGFGMFNSNQETQQTTAQGAEPIPEENQNSSKGSGGMFGRLPIEQLKNFMPPEQQSKLETMQLLMSAMQMT